jgi:hypothetical protein
MLSVYLLSVSSHPNAMRNLRFGLLNISNLITIGLLTLTNWVAMKCQITVATLLEADALGLYQQSYKQKRRHLQALHFMWKKWNQLRGSTFVKGKTLTERRNRTVIDY